VSQARRRQRFNTSSNQKRIGHGLREIVLISFCFMGLYLFLSLLTYSGVDPGIFHSGQGEALKNMGGVAGALFSDLLFELFGYFAYLFPIMIVQLGWVIYQGHHHDILAEPRSLVVPGSGFVLTLSAGCGLAIVHFTESPLPSHAGGMLGKAVGHSLQSMFSELGATLLLLALFFTGVTLLTGLSWLKLMDILGFHTLRLTPVVRKYLAQRFWPRFALYSQQLLHVIGSFLKVLLRQSRRSVKRAYVNWQSRRAEWQARREEYEAEEYYDDDDELMNDEESPEKPPEKIMIATKDAIEITPILPAEPTVSEYLDVPTPATVSPSGLPSLSLLESPPHQPTLPDVDALTRWMQNAFNLVHFEAIVIAVHPGPVLTGFEVQLTTPLESTRLDVLSEELKRILRTTHLYLVETTPGILGIEVPNAERQSIDLKELLNYGDYQDSLSPLTIALGKDVNGLAVIVDLARVPHLLIAGSHPMEQAALINTFLVSFLYKSTPDAVRLLLVDNTAADLAIYEELPHLLTPVITKKAEALLALQWCEHEMERRYRLMADKGVRNIEAYNLTLSSSSHQQFLEGLTASTDTLYYIVVLVQEIAELMQSDIAHAIEEQIASLVQRARAAGIHIILATQYPSSEVITSFLKANIPTRIALQVTTKSESRAILGQMGAESLLGEGDMLYMTAAMGVPVRIHGSSVTIREVKKVVADLKGRAKPQYVNLTPATS